MKLNVYMGAYRTAGTHLFEMAKMNADMLNDLNIHNVKESVYKAAVTRALKALEDQTEAPLVKEQFLKDLAEGFPAKTLVYFGPQLAGNITRPAGGGLIFPRIKNATRSLSDIMMNQDVRICMSIREPSSFLASCYGLSLINANMVPFDDYIKDVKFEVLRWSNCLDRLSTPFFNAKTQSYSSRPIVWRMEDYPYIWRDALAAVTGVDNSAEFVGDMEPINTGLSLYGSYLMFKYLQKHAPKARGDFKKVREAFLEKYPNTEDKPDDPYWSKEQIKEMQYAYEDDWYYIERMDNVQAISRRVFD